MGAAGFVALASQFTDRTVVTYVPSGLGAARAKCSALVSYQRPSSPGHADRPAPAPAMLGLPAEDDGSRDDPLVGQNIVTCNSYRHDFDALRAGSTRVVIGVGATSGQGIVGRAGLAVAERLGTAPVTFPGDPGGFLGPEYRGLGRPDPLPPPPPPVPPP